MPVPPGTDISSSARPAAPTARPGRPASQSQPTTADVAIAGGGCAGLAIACALADLDPALDVLVVDGRTPERDHRTWCFWDENTNPVPEAVSASWTRFEIRSGSRVSIAEDPDHPYRMIHAADYRRAMARRLTTSATRSTVHTDLVRTDRVRAMEPGRMTLATGTVSAPTVLDARGALSTGRRQPGRVHLQQRFIGQWIRTSQKVFDPSTVTLMDYTGTRRDAVQFMYVLPISATEALVEATAFLPDDFSSPAFRTIIADYLSQRWGLAIDDWVVTGEEAGNIPMTDQAAPPARIPVVGAGGGLTRSSSGYAFSRIQRHARAVARAIVAGEPVPVFRDRWRTRTLDAVFLRFLRDQPDAAADVFLRMFGRLPGPVIVRFLTDRSSPLDELRLVMALPKRQFLRAAARTALERLGRTEA